MRPGHTAAMPWFGSGRWVSVLLGFAACNQPPTSATLHIEPANPTTSVDLRAVVDVEPIDPNGDPLTLSWAWTRDGQLQLDLLSDTVPADRTSKGEIWSVTLLATDGELTSGAAEASAEIQNTPPNLEIALAPGLPKTSDDLLATATPFDADGDPVQVSWAWTVDGADAGVRESRVPSSATRRGQTWEVSATPNDGAADGTTRSASVLVDNSPPTLRSANLDPVEIYDRADGASSVVRVVWDAQDPDADRLSASIVWFVDGQEVAPNPDATVDGRLFRKGQTVQAEIVVSDGVSSTRAALTDRVRVLNSAPRITAAYLEPAALTEATTATPVASGWSDEDGDPEGGTVLWWINGRSVSSAPTLDGRAWKRGDRVAAEITPFDGEDAGTPVRTPEVVVLNSAPTLLGLTLSPTPVRTDEDLLATPGTTLDPDDDPVSVKFAWTVNGARVGPTGTTLSGAYFEKGDLVTATATPSDGLTSGPAVSASATIANTPPKITGISLSPSVLYTDDTAGVTFTTSDADGDPLAGTITWTVNGSVVGTATTLSGSTFSRGDVVGVSVTVDDGTDRSLPATASVKVANRPPTSPGISFSPSSPGDSDDLRCVITSAATDADGDSLSYTFDWTRNGSTFSSVSSSVYAGDTVPAWATTPGDSFTCTARATDGTTAGASTSISVKITGGTRTWSFTDTSSDDVGATDLKTFFTTAAPATSDYLYFQVDGGSSGGAWCSERADWYATQYLAYAGGSGTYLSSGSWQRWWRSTGGSWSSAVTSGATNYFGPVCSSATYDWCSEWGLGGKYLAVMPANTSTGESYASTWSGGSGWSVIVRVASTRSAACGF